MCPNGYHRAMKAANADQFAGVFAATKKNNLTIVMKWMP